MKTIILWFLFLLNFTARGQHGSYHQKDLEEVRQIHNQLVSNWLKHDTVKQNQIVHEDFMYVCPNGQIADRSEYIKIFYGEYDPQRAKDLTVEIDHIRIFDNLALVTAHLQYKLERDDHSLTPRQTPFTDFYLRTEGKWKLIQVQVTPPAENFTSLQK